MVTRIKLTRAQLAGVAKWLDERIDSHGVYSLAALDELAPHGVTYDARTKTLTLVSGDVTLDPALATVTESAPFTTNADTVRAMKARPSGGSMKRGYDPRELVFWGYSMAQTMCRLILGVNPGATYSGRGFVYRACLEALQAAASEASS